MSYVVTVGDFVAGAKGFYDAINAERLTATDTAGAIQFGAQIVEGFLQEGSSAAPWLKMLSSLTSVVPITTGIMEMSAGVKAAVSSLKCNTLPPR